MANWWVETIAAYRIRDRCVLFHNLLHESGELWQFAWLIYDHDNTVNSVLGVIVIITSARRYCDQSCWLVRSLVCVLVNVRSAAGGRQAGGRSTSQGVAGAWRRIAPTSAFSNCHYRIMTRVYMTSKNQSCVYFVFAVSNLR